VWGKPRGGSSPLIRIVALLLVAAVIVALVLSLVDIGGPGSARSELRGLVTGVPDGDTVRVALDNGRKERVRLLGIDAPELNPAECFGREAAGRARELADDEQVRLVRDPTQDERDRFGRLLAYVLLDDENDLGRQLVAEGYASVFVFNRAFKRLDSYRDAEASARSGKRGLWRTCRRSEGS
jgi:micrococcal nuclease